MDRRALSAVPYCNRIRGVFPLGGSLNTAISTGGVDFEGGEAGLESMVVRLVCIRFTIYFGGTIASYYDVN